MNKIYDYKSVKECIKCDRNMFYDVPSDSDLHGERSVRSIVFIKEQTETTEVKGSPEHLEITCSDCGFTHKEKCKDAS